MNDVQLPDPCDRCGFITGHSLTCDFRPTNASDIPNTLVVNDSNQVEIRTISSTGGHKGKKRARYSLIPPFVLDALAKHYGRGAEKYADHNWRKGYAWGLSYDALMRHLQAWWAGEELDTCPPTGEGCSFVTNEGEPFEGVPGVSCYNHTGNHHLDGVMFHAFALRQFVHDANPDHDDRFKTSSQ